MVNRLHTLFSETRALNEKRKSAEAFLGMAIRIPCQFVMFVHNSLIGILLEINFSGFLFNASYSHETGTANSKNIKLLQQYLKVLS